jgi:hypothetical protein
MKKNKISRAEAIFLLVLTITMPIVFTALQPEVQGNEIKTNSSVDFFSNIIKMFISLFDLIPSVSAEGDLGCCPETITGSRFQTVLLEECIYKEECLYPGQLNCWKRNETCPLGCCVSPSGMCIKNAFREGCPTGSFIANDNMCDQSELCKEGCCTVGIQSFISTNFTCYKKQGVWDPSITLESQCISSIEQQRMGCCKSFAGCEYLTKAECSANRLGTFYADKKCTNDQGIPGCDCVLNSTGKCVEGKPDIYYADTCGNVYIKDIPKETCPQGFCDPGTNTCDSGDCEYTYQNNVDGKFTPKNTSRTMTNGASWCVYDTSRDDPNNPTPGESTMGSRNWRHYCLYGKDYVEPCSDYRQQICMEQDGTPVYAACVDNFWTSCLNITVQEECSANPFCYWWKDVQLYNDSGTRFIPTEKFTEDWVVFGSTKEGMPIKPICLPRYPPGLSDGQDGFPNREEICNLGSYICQFKQSFWGLDTENKECVDADKSSELYTYMAHRCKSLGDCGTWFNWLEEQTNGFTVIQFDEKPNESSQQPRGKKELGLPQPYADYLDYTKSIWNNPTREQGAGNGMIAGIIWGVILGLTAVGAITASLIAAISGIHSVLFTLGIAYTMNSAGLVGAGYSMGSVLGGGLLVVAGVVLIIIAFTKGPGLEQGIYMSLGAGLIAAGTALIWAGLSQSWNPGGLIIAEIGVAVLAITALLYWASYDEKYYWVQCNPSTPSFGSENCEKCNNDVMRPCSKYRCESLGTACQFKDSIEISGVEFPLADGSCVSIENTNRPPYIQNISVYDRHNTKVFSKTGLGTSPSTIDINMNGQPFPDGTSILVEITMNTKAICRWDVYPTLNFSSMDFPYQSTVLRENLKQTFAVSRASPYIYVRCADVHGNANINEYLFRFSTKTGSDMTPPEILATDRDYYKYFANGLEQLPLFIYVNENSYCRWSKQDQEYELMNASVQCQTKLMQHGFRCSTNLTGLQSGITNYFFLRCNDTSGNVNHQSYVLELESAPPIIIKSVIPENNSRIEGCSFEPQVNLTVETEGGVDGNATCYWTLKSDYSNLTRFFQTNSNIHVTEATVYPNQINTIYIKCGDSALNDARTTTQFMVYVDLEKPSIIKVLGGTSLTIKTNEEAKCSFNFNFGKKTNSCSFIANDSLYAKEFSTDGLTHTTSWDSDPWYIKCYDKCGNGVFGNDCTIIYPQELG